MNRHLTFAVTAPVRRALLAVFAIAVVAGALGVRAQSSLTAGGFYSAASESARAEHLLERDYGFGTPNMVLVIHTPRGADSPDAASSARSVVADLERDHRARQVVSYWTYGRPAVLRADDGRSALALAFIPGNDDQVRSAISGLTRTFQGVRHGLDVRVAGSAETLRSLRSHAEGDLLRAEAIAVPLTALLLFLAFGSMWAAAIPLVCAAGSTLLTLAIVRLVSLATPISVYGLNLATGLALGLGIDYSLLLVTRFRQEARAVDDPELALVQTMRTAGRTIVYSGLVVGTALATLFLFPLTIIRSFAVVGVTVVTASVLTALTVVPVMIRVLGERATRTRLSRRSVDAPSRWGRLAEGATRYPRWSVALSVLVLLVLATPVLHLRAGLADDRSLPASVSVRSTTEEIRSHYRAREADALAVLVPGATRLGSAALSEYAMDLSSLRSVARVDTAEGAFVRGRRVAPPSPLSSRFNTQRGAWLTVVPSVDAYSAAGERLVTDLRTMPAPSKTLVTGSAAYLVDTLDALRSRLPAALGLILLTTFLLLALMARSVVPALKALVLNGLTMGTAIGSCVWVFQDGHLRGLLGHFAVPGFLDASTPILLFCLAFGLSMDYEVFLLERVRELHQGGLPIRAAVVAAAESMGRLIGMAAAIVAVVFISFAVGDVTFIKMLGVSLAFTVLVDATLVRGVLFPAALTAAGRWAWWQPGGRRPAPKDRTSEGLPAGVREPA